MSATNVAAAVTLGAMLVASPGAKADESQTANARSAPSVDAGAAAQTLFVEGRRLVAEGRFPEGCAKLEQSDRLDPAAGTQINLADCYEKSGKLASAWILFHEAVVAAQRAERADWAEQARQRAGMLEPRVPKLTVVVDEPLSSLASLELFRNEVRVESSTYGSPVPVDPGTYEIAATAPDHRRWATHVAVEAGTQVVLHVPALVEESPVQAGDRSPRWVATPAARPPGDPSIGSTQRTCALALGATALVLAGAGAYAGLSALATNRDAAARCPASPRCTDPQAIALTDDASRAATVSTISLVTSGLIMAVAGSLFFTAPVGRRPPPITVSVGGRDVTLAGRW